MADIKFKAGLDTKDFDRKLQNASKELNKTEKETKKLSASLGKLKTSMLAVGAAVASIVAIGVKASKSSRDLEKLAFRAGTTKKQFEAIALAASKYGIEQEKVADILKDTNDKIGDFIATGAGPMVDFFEKIGPKVGVTKEQFKGLSSDQAIGLYIKSLEKAGVSQQEMTFYLEALASDATDLFKIFGSGSKDIARAEKELEQLNLSLTKADNKTLKGFNDSLALSLTAISLASDKIGVALAPSLQKVTDAFNESMKEGGALRKVLDGLNGILDKVANNFDRVTAYVKSGITVLAAYTAGMVAFKVATMGAATAMTVLRGALIRTGVGALIVGIGELIYQWDTVSQKVKEFALGTELAFAQAGLATKKYWSMFLQWAQDALNNVQQAITDTFTFNLPGGIKLEGPQFDPFTFANDKSGILQSIANIERIKKAMTDLRKVNLQVGEDYSINQQDFENDTMDGDKSDGGTKTPANYFDQLKSKTTEWRDSMKQGANEMQTMISNAYGKMEDALVGFVQTGKLNFKDLMASMASDLIRFSIRSMMFGGPAGGGGIFGTLFSRNGNAFGSSGQLNYANGGVFNQKFAMPMGDGRTAIGAEAGPEAIMPLQRDKSGKLGVTLAGGSIGGGNQNNIVFNTTVNAGDNTSPKDARAFANEFNNAIEAKVIQTMSKVQNVGIGGRR